MRVVVVGGAWPGVLVALGPDQPRVWPSPWWHQPKIRRIHLLGPSLSYGAMLGFSRSPSLRQLESCHGPLALLASGLVLPTAGAMA